MLPSILRLTYYHSEDFVDIVNMLDKRLNDKGKYWRHVYKVRAIAMPSAFPL
jgi:epsin